MDRAALRKGLSAALTPPELAGYTLPAGMCREEFRAMGTTISLLLPRRQRERGRQIVQALFAKWEQALSRFLPASELSHLNEQAGTPVVVSSLLYRVLTTALRAAQATEGVYDPTLLKQLKRLGYDRSFDELAAGSEGSGGEMREEEEGEPGGRWREIQMYPIAHCVVLPVGTHLDFGGIAKGMAVDAAREELRLQGIEPALINAGGDLAVLGVPPASEAWGIAVTGRERSWTVPLRSGAMATSGIGRRQWWQGQVRRHHLLDPRSGLPVQNGLWSVTVVADRCEQAEVAAKVAFILGPEQGAEFLRKHRLAGLFVFEDDRRWAMEPWPVHLMEEGV